MRISKARSVAFLAIAALATLAACDRGDRKDGGEAADGDTKAVQIYEVPPAQLQSMKNALGDVLANSKTGSVSSSDGRLVVLAPTSTQASISKAIEELSRRPANSGPAGDAPVRLRFWLLEGSAEATPPDPRLAPLKPALDEASRGLGLHGYTLQGFTDVLTSPGKQFRSQAGNIIVAGDANRLASGVALSASIEAAQMGGGWSGSIHTDALLKPGQFLVLSTTAGSDGNMRLVVAQAQLPAGKS